ncbi:MAG: hypothetical protein LCI00_25540 [Chloroflexi bacterium]|nr:hypothetical protein [Chloroflexota bacterium]MCC6895410.1 hypothetical protein [Anaerolineae bacterium]
MDKGRLSEMLGLQPMGTFLVKSVTAGGWGSSLGFACLYELSPSSEPFTFTLQLDDCREIQWRVYAHLKHAEDQTLPTATFVNLRLGSDNHRKPLHLLTDFFGLTVSYGTLRLEK